MLRPGLRTAGTLMRAVLPRFTARTFRLCNRFLDAFGRGRPLARCISYEQVHITRADGTKLRLCVYAPRKRRAGVPGLLWLHGGGYAIGVPEQDIAFIRRFVRASGCAVVSPDYTRSLDAPYPAALDDSYLALLWLRDNGGAYGARSDQLFVGGDSAGGGLAAALCLYARDRGEAAIAFQMPLYPMLDDRMDTPSMLENDAPAWNAASNEAAWRLYLGPLYGTDNLPSYAAPSRETDYSRLPPALIYVGSIEPFRDETVQYARALEAAGIEVFFREYEGCFHAFDVLCAGSRVAKEARAFLLDGFAYAAAHLFKKQPSGD